MRTENCEVSIHTYPGECGSSFWKKLEQKGECGGILPHIPAIVLCVITLMSSHAEAQDIYIHPDEVSVSIGESFAVEVMIRNVTDLSAFEFRISFDKDISRVISVSRGSLWDNPDYLWDTGAIDNASGTMGPVLGAASSGSAPVALSVDSNGDVLASVIFQAVTEGVSPIDLTDVIACSVTGNEISVSTLNGIVNSVAGGMGPVQEMAIDLATGWNLISLCLQPTNIDCTSVLSSVAGKYDAIWAYDAITGMWRRYVADGPSFLNDLDTMDSSTGYWIMMNQPGLLIFQGVKSETPIALKSGWNLVGYNCQDAMSIEDYLSRIDGECNSVWTYCPGSENWLRYDASAPDFLNNLEIVEPGRGYWVDVTSECTWNINGNAALAAPPMTMGLRRNHVSYEIPRMPFTIWGTVEIDHLRMGDLSGYRCSSPIVFLKMDDEVRSSYRLGTVPRYGDFYVLDVPALTDSSAHQTLKKFDQENSYLPSANTRAELCVLIDGQALRKSEGASAPVTAVESVLAPSGKPGQLIRFDLSVRMSPITSLLYQNYPNPLNPETWIPYQLREEAYVEIRIYTTTGRLVRTLNLGRQQAGFYTDSERAAYWDGRNEAGDRVAGGIYFYTIQAGDYTAVKKMAVVK